MSTGSADVGVYLELVRGVGGQCSRVRFRCLLVPVSVVLGPVKLTSLAVNVALNPWSQIWPMDMRLRLPKAGNTLERRAPIGNWGKGRRAVCDARIYAPFVIPTRMMLDVEDLFVHGVEGPRKWMVQPESTMARVFVTKVRGAVVFATFSFYLVPSHSHLGLFLSDLPFVLDFVAPLSCPTLVFSQSRLEWFKE